MPGFRPKLIGDAIQLAASVAVIGGIVLLVLDVADRPGSQSGRGVSAEKVPVGERALPAGIAAERQAVLGRFVRQQCGVCHGAEGSLGPVLSGVTLETLTDRAVALTILHGRLDKGMPAWEAQFSEADALWIARALKANAIWQ